MMNQQLSKASSASEALDQLLNYKPTPVINKSKPMITFDCTKKSSTSSLKRSRSSALESFDMSVFQEASSQVEESIAFPTIEWSFNDDEEEEEVFPSPPSKRRCNGLNRSSQASFDLSSFCVTKRNGSNGSLC